MTQVEEPNPTLATPLVTAYTYNALGKLTQTAQGSQIRTFVLDSLGRMTSQTLPESGTTSFTYDSEDQLLTKTDARGITVTMTYGTSGGSIHQGVSRTYSDSTPAVSFGYNTQGLRTSMADGVGTVTYSYNANTDKLTQESRILTGVSGTFTTGYAYNIKGDLTQMTYPSGRIVNLNYATGGGCCNSRLSSVVDQTTNTTIAGSLAYNAAGETTSMTLGNGVIETFGYNSRLQQTAITAALGPTTLMNFAYDYGTSTTNTGRVLSRADSIQPEHSTKYAYDSIYRLSQVVSNDAGSSWAIAWSFDTWGNRLTQTPQGLATSKVGTQTLGYTNNRLTTNTYDAAGNQTNDGLHNYTFNAENQITQMDAGAAVYAYDGENRRMKKTVGSETTYYFYGITGLLCEFTTTNTGATQASAGDRATYRTSDSNGTAVLLISASGTVVENNRALPYGESWLSEVGSINNQKFTTYFRDGESGLDYAEARYFANNNGRFNSPDPAAPELAFPQSLNRYVYAMNDPINITDPTGKGFWGSLWKKIKSIFVSSLPQCGPGLGSPSCVPTLPIVPLIVIIPPTPEEEEVVRRPYYLQVIEDCFERGLTLAGGLARRRTYELRDQNGDPLTGPVDVRETNEFQGNRVAVSGQTWPGGVFADTLQAGTRNIFQQIQRFFARTRFGGKITDWVPVFVRELDRKTDHMSLGIYMDKTHIIINGDDGMIVHEDGSRTPRWCNN